MHIEEATQQQGSAVVNRPSYHPILHGVARVISVVFHPLFIPVYLSAFVLYYTPIFPGFAPADKVLLLLRFLVMYTLFPLVTVLLAKGLGFVETIYLRTQKDRIIPYVACGLYYFWMWYVLRNQPEFPREMVSLALAIFLASSGGLVLNSYVKVSMHAILHLPAGPVGRCQPGLLPVAGHPDHRRGLHRAPDQLRPPPL
jgi:hypothetical protein